MPPRIHGTLDGQARADTFTLWRKPGRYRYELEVRGVGAAEFCLEAFRPADGDASTGIWEAIEERSHVRAGPKLVGVVAVPGAWVDPRLNAGWVQLRLRIFRTAPNETVQYEFYLEPGEGAPKEQGLR